jgi:hypothetical protein
MTTSGAILNKTGGWEPMGASQVPAEEEEGGDEEDEGNGRSTNDASPIY